MTERIFNFSAGPAIMPLPVLEEAGAHMLALPGVGMSVMEISHRSKTFDEIIQGAEAGLRELLNIPKDYAVLFLQGGATLQFAMVPMNFLSLDGSADYIVTGNRQHFPDSLGRMRVINPRQLVELVTPKP